jgi:hypothetical protein
MAAATVMTLLWQSAAYSHPHALCSGEMGYSDPACITCVQDVFLDLAWKLHVRRNMTGGSMAVVGIGRGFCR